MKFDWARSVVLILLIGAFVAGCGNAASVPQPSSVRSSGAYDTATKLSDPTPLQDVQEEITGMLTDLHRGHCPAQSPLLTSGMYLDSRLDLHAAKVILCRYRGQNDTPPLGLRSSTTIANAATAESWRRRFRDMPAVDPTTHRCPGDDGSAVLIAFQRNDGTFAVAKASLQGCKFVTMSGVTLSAKDPVSFQHDLLQLVP